MRTFDSLIEKLITESSALDIDLLLLMRDEVPPTPSPPPLSPLQIFSKPDCCYRTLLTIRASITDHKSLLTEKPSSELRTPEFVQNVLDLLRVIPSPVKGEAIDSSLCLVNGDQANEDNESEDGSQSDSSDEEEKETKKLTKKRALKADVAPSSTKKRRRDFNLSEQILDVHSHIKLFSKCWVLFFSLPLTTKQIKLSLKHLPEYVIPILYQPLLLADYLSNLVANGGVIGVLALESLFHLIIEYNLDYPNFFNCLYSLLNVEVLSAKYRTKYMNLLHLSLKSSNVPEYCVAGFIKKLSVLTLMIPGPAVMFCLTQVRNQSTRLTHVLNIPLPLPPSLYGRLFGSCAVILNAWS